MGITFQVVHEVDRAAGNHRGVSEPVSDEVERSIEARQSVPVRIRVKDGLDISGGDELSKGYAHQMYPASSVQAPHQSPRHREDGGVEHTGT